MGSEMSHPNIQMRPTSLDFLRAVYWNDKLPLHTRMRAAMAVLPFEHPKLAVTAFMDGKSFAALLEKRIMHMKRVNAAQIINQIPEEKPKPAPQVEIKPHLPTVPDKRYRRY
jgi:hypothetical protein